MIDIKKKYLVMIALLTLVLGAAGGLAYFTAFPQHYFGGYPLIPVFFLVLGLFSIQMTETCRRRMPQRMLQVYLLVRVVRMLLAVAVMTVYCVAVRHEARAFLLTFVANYLIYLIYDSWFYFHIEYKSRQQGDKATRQQGSETLSPTNHESLVTLSPEKERYK